MAEVKAAAVKTNPMVAKIAAAAQADLGKAVTKVESFTNVVNLVVEGGKYQVKFKAAK